ncbi:hypothetical protein OPV22_008315 [Ensete ventricosum]|uniref:Uncharacterized protein n=1 Tax=Ensete ventricosum TaxID=4639 RepID=A0AAV8RD77_ENSVE|nr:hypothetical protein OPV22_008315 [Ensete ventricosum]
MEDEEVAAVLRGVMEEFSASATVVPFDSARPLLRGPVPAGPADDPTSGPFVLAFRDSAAWRSAYRATESMIIDQCEAGARAGCSISASNKCKPPWWKFLFGITAMDYAEREQCEEREMALCLAAAKDACVQFAKEKCLQPFRDARIASDNLKGTPQFVLWDSDTVETEIGGKSKESEPAFYQQETFRRSSRCNSEVTNYRGSVLMGIAGSENNATTRVD